MVTNFWELTCKKYLIQYVGKTLEDFRLRWAVTKITMTVINHAYMHAEVFIWALLKYWSLWIFRTRLNNNYWKNRPFRSLKREDYWRQTLCIEAPYGLKIEDRFLSNLLGLVISGKDFYFSDDFYRVPLLV